MNLWNGIVGKNRREEFLRFEDAEPDRIHLTSESLASKFIPTTDMEKEIEVVCPEVHVIPRFWKKVI